MPFRVPIQTSMLTLDKLPVQTTKQWPCQSGEADPPVLTGSCAYGTRGGMPALVYQAASVGTATWNALQRYSPLDLNAPLVVTFYVHGFLIGVSTSVQQSVTAGFGSSNGGFGYVNLRSPIATSPSTTKLNMLVRALDGTQSATKDVTGAWQTDQWNLVQLVFARDGSIRARLNSSSGTDCTAFGVATDPTQPFSITASPVNSSNPLSISNLVADYPSGVPT